MSQRFQIEDLVIQDPSGVVFRALDTETDRIVAVRRFFPFGATGGGLHEDEQAAYNIAVGRLAGISHPALRAVICGGCDAVDGMPFIATEWVEGTRLQTFIARGPLAPADAADLLTRALEVCELLSEVLAEEAVWVETDLQSIVVGTAESGRGVTFSIAPLKWLGKNDGQRGLESLITLAEEIMGWQGRTVSDQAGMGLGGWLKWFRGAARTTTLREAREMLAASIGVEPPAPVKQLVRQATRPVVTVRTKKKSSRYSFLIGGSVSLIAIALGGLGLIQWRNSKLQLETATAPETVVAELPLRAAEPVTVAAIEEPAAEPEAPAPPAPAERERTAEEASLAAAELSAKYREAEGEKEARRAEIGKQGNVFLVGDRELLLEKKNSEVSLEGTLEEVRFSRSGSTLYFRFSSSTPESGPRGYISKDDLAPDTDISAYQKLIGRNVRLNGRVKTPNSVDRPEIEMKNLASIKVVE